MAVGYNISVFMIHAIRKLLEVSKSMKKIFFKLSIAAFSVAIISAFGAVLSSESKAPLALSAEDVTEEAPDFSGEVEFDVGDMSVNATSSSETDFSTSYQVTYSTGGKAIVDNALGGSFVNVIGDVVDGEDVLVKRATEIHNLPDAEQEAMHAKVEAGELETEEYDGHIFRFNAQKSDIFIPRTISRGFYGLDSIFDVNVVSVLDHALTANSSAEKIYIPSSVQIIAADAFTSSVNLTDIYIEFPLDSLPEGWAEGWNAGIDVDHIHVVEDVFEFVKVSDREGYRHPSFTQFSTVGDDSINYMFGYVPRDTSKGYYPIYVEYKLVGNNKVFFLPIQKNNSESDYDSVGGGIGAGASTNRYTNSFFIDIITSIGDEVDFESIVIHNIFKAKREITESGLTWLPDFEHRYYVKPGHAFSRVNHLEDFVTIKFGTISGFAGYTAVTADVSKVKNGIEVYKANKEYYYNIYKNNLESGKAYIRYRLTQLHRASYLVSAGGKQVEIDPATEVSQYVMKKNLNNNLGFVYKNAKMGLSDYSVKNVESFAVKGMTITIDVVNDGNIVKSSYKTARFGIIYIKTPVDPVSTFSVDLFVILLAVGYSAAAIAVATTLFFVYKKIYKNDEFKRLKPKQFIRKAIIYWLTSLAVVLALAFIILRNTAFTCAIAVYNPVDTFIVIFGIAAIIIIGYYIRNIVIAYRARQQKKKATKLGLLNEVADDGTK